MMKSERPREPSSGLPVRPRASATSLSVALENHLKPSSVCGGPYSGDRPSGDGVAIVSVRETSDPPGRYQHHVRNSCLGECITYLRHPLPRCECLSGVTTIRSE